MNERRIARIQELIKQRVAEVVAHELNDPKLGMITITRVEVDKELMSAKVFWSTLGGEQERAKQARILDKAAGYVQGEVARVLTTRTVPRVKFLFDQRIEGAVRMQSLLDSLRAEREAREAAQQAEGGPEPAEPEATDADAPAERDEP
jgi:ribosome-binding factor A